MKSVLLFKYKKATKYLLLLSMFTIFNITVKAQEISIYKRNPMKELKLKKLLQDSLQFLKHRQPATRTVAPPPEPGVLRIEIKGDFQGENQKGDQVYTMQPDHMPCVVPSKKVVLDMPVAGLEKKKDELLTLPKP